MPRDTTTQTEIAAQIAKLGEVVDFASLPHRVLQWLAYESDGHPLAEDAYDYLDSLPVGAGDLITAAPPCGPARIAG